MMSTWKLAGANVAYQSELVRHFKIRSCMTLSYTGHVA